MTRFFILPLALFLAAPALAQDEPSTTLIDAPSVLGEPKPDDAAAEVARNITRCEGQSFVFAWGAGANPTKVTLCSDKGASHEQVVRMLDDAATKLEQTTSLPDDRRIALVQQVRGKIAELEKAQAMKAAQVPEPAISSPLAATVPPMPRPLASLPRTVTPASSPLLLPKPRLGFECYTPGDIGVGGPCVTMNRDTRLTIKAGELIQPATSLRFLRSRELRAEIQIGPMRKGQSKRIVVPRDVCGGVVTTEIEIQVARGTHVVDTRGPYLMRC